MCVGCVVVGWRGRARDRERERARAQGAAAAINASRAQPTPTWRLSTENATESTSLVWPTKRRVVAPVVRSHRRSVPSHEPESANWPSLEITTSCT